WFRFMKGARWPPASRERVWWRCKGATMCCSRTSRRGRASWRRCARSWPTLRERRCGPRSVALGAQGDGELGGRAALDVDLLLAVVEAVAPEGDRGRATGDLDVVERRLAQRALAPLHRDGGGRAAHVGPAAGGLGGGGLGGGRGGRRGVGGGR